MFILKGCLNLTKEERMLNGNLFKGILIFSLPLMLSNLLQVLFNMCDLAIVGKFGSSIALGAVGSTVMLISLYLGFNMGIGNGVNVFVGRYVGCKDFARVKKVIHSGFFVSIVFGVLLSLIAILSSFFVLKLLGTKDELISDAYLYCSIYFIGLPAMTIYNYGNGTLSAVGETKKPLIFLIIAGVINLLLNLLFVIVFKMGVAGVATATVISQYVSACCIIITLLLTKGDHKLVFKNSKIDKRSIKEILSVGLASGVQYSIFAIANMFIQSGINSFDHITVEGISAATNADSFIYESMYAIYAACTSFISINYGASNKKRIKESFYITTLYSFLIGLIFGFLLFIFGKEFLYFFTNDDIVVEAGLKRIRIMAFAYAISAFMDNTTAASRGLGKTFIPTIIVIIGSCIFRIIWLYTVFYHWHTIESLYLLYPISWIITAIVEIIYFIYIYRKETALILA